MKKNTAIICLSPHYGGMELDAIRYAQLLSDSLNIILIAKKGSSIEEGYTARATNNTIKLISIPFRSNFSFSIIFGVRKIIKEHKIQNVIFFGASELKSLYFSFLNLDINLIIRHGTTKSHPKKDWLHQLVYSQVNWHIPICKHIANNVKYIIPFGKSTLMKVIYPSLPEKFFEYNNSSRKNDEILTLLIVSRITEGKGHIDAIQACATLDHNGISFNLVCVGDIDPNFSEKLNNTLNNISYRSNIKYPGFSDNVVEYYNRADIFIFPSRGEGLSNSFIEALGSGLQCVSYNNTSFPELKDVGFKFQMAKDGNIEDLVAKLNQSVMDLKTNDTDLNDNITLAKELFCNKRERTEILALLV
ncbi:MAG TPA: glycosyltransferase [Ignavibacteria bacterium]|nr:glycosyltransferase [Ignavibacteria bacterium]